jgi:alpha-glucosidase
MTSIFHRAAYVCSFFCTLLLLGTTAEAAWQTVGNVTSVTQPKPNRVVMETSSQAKVSFEFVDINVVRVRVAPSGIFERDFSYAIDYSRDRHTPAVIFKQTARDAILKNSYGTTITIGKTPFSIRITDETGAVVIEDDPRHPTLFDKTTGEIRTTKIRSSEVETYYGFGEKAFAGMSRNGLYIVNWNTDTFAYQIGTDPIYQSIPFFYALHDGKAYGVFFNNTFRTWFDMGKTSPESYSFGADGGELDYYVFTGGRERSPKRVLGDYANLTGKTPLPPIWALGYQQSRWSYFPESRVREIGAGFRSRKIPADVIYLDVDYMDGYRVFTWDRQRFPDPMKMITDLKNDGFKTVLIIDPGIKVAPNYSIYSDGKAQGVFVKNPNGTELNRDVWPKASVFPDFTDSKARVLVRTPIKDQSGRRCCRLLDRYERARDLHDGEVRETGDRPSSGEDVSPRDAARRRRISRQSSPVSQRVRDANGAGDLRRNKEARARKAPVRPHACGLCGRPKTLRSLDRR